MLLYIFDIFKKEGGKAPPKKQIQKIQLFLTNCFLMTPNLMF